MSAHATTTEGSAKEDIEKAIAMLESKGVNSVLVADEILPEDAPFRVVRVLVPTLEGYFSMRYRVTGQMST
jgi:ribosomal protein S12 methylthiotransferase accessory factor YcaO